MWKTQLFSLRQVALSVCTAGMLAISLQMTGVAEMPMLIRSVPLEVSGYTEATDLDQQVQTAEGTVQVLTTTMPLIVHMEALRRAYTAFGQNAEETQKLLKDLKERYMADTSNAEKFFDYGYAQLVMEGNKNGLFFLRKANDALTSPYTSLAYALAQVDVDRMIDNATPDALTTRKMDVGYKLKDALLYNREDRLAGIWPSYVHILEALAEYPAFESLRSEDVTTLYVPYGSTSLNRSESSNQLLLALAPSSSEEASEPLPAAPEAPTVETSCVFSPLSASEMTLAQSKSMDLDNDGQAETVNFYQTAAGSPYVVDVTDSQNRVIGRFTSYKAPYIAEDLDGDNRFELVVRQFDKDPYHPLAVYRWNGSCYGQDTGVASFFK